MAIDPKKVKPLRRTPQTRRKNPGGTRTQDQREMDLAWLAGKVLAGLPQKEIVAQLNAIRPYKLDRKSVGNDMAVLNERWRTASAVNLDAHKQVMLAKLDLMEQRCYRYLDAAELPRKVTTTSVSRTLPGEPQKKGDKSPPPSPRQVFSGTREGYDNNSGQWLKMLRWVMEQKAKLLGLYAPLKLDVPEGTSLNFGDTNVTNIAVRIEVNSTKTREELATYPIVDAPPPLT